APQKVGEAGGEGVVIERAALTRLTVRIQFAAEQEVRGDQRRLDAQLDAALEALALALRHLRAAYQALDFGLRHRAAIGFAGERGQDFARAGIAFRRVLRLAENDAAVGRGERLRLARRAGQRLRRHDGGLGDL